MRMAFRSSLSRALVVFLATGLTLLWFTRDEIPPHDPVHDPVHLSPKKTTSLNGLVWIPAGTFEFGSDAGLREESPARTVHVDGFWISKHEITNQQFAAFIEATGYVTVAEREPAPSDRTALQFPEAGSAVFTPSSSALSFLDWWRFTPGANWRHPTGPSSTIADRPDFPVVHIAYEDAEAYASWAGERLPTEIEWEYAAKLGLGSVAVDGQPTNANTWQGLFPAVNTGKDGHIGLAPVMSYSADRIGLYDMIGNVWEWTSDPYSHSHNASHKRGLSTDQRVIKGGSFLCAPNYCMRYRPSARHAGDTGLGTNHIGFRTIARPSNAS